MADPHWTPNPFEAARMHDGRQWPIELPESYARPNGAPKRPPACSRRATRRAAGGRRPNTISVGRLSDYPPELWGTRDRQRAAELQGKKDPSAGDRRRPDDPLKDLICTVFTFGVPGPRAAQVLMHWPASAGRVVPVATANALFARDKKRLLRREPQGRSRRSPIPTTTSRTTRSTPSCSDLRRRLDGLAYLRSHLREFVFRNAGVRRVPVAAVAKEADLRSRPTEKA
jgi:hypothetical protein